MSHVGSWGSGQRVCCTELTPSECRGAEGLSCLYLWDLGMAFAKWCVSIHVCTAASLDSKCRDSTGSFGGVKVRPRPRWTAFKHSEDPRRGGTFPLDGGSGKEWAACPLTGVYPPSWERGSGTEGGRDGKDRLDVGARARTPDSLAAAAVQQSTYFTVSIINDSINSTAEQLAHRCVPH